MPSKEKYYFRTDLERAFAEAPQRYGLPSMPKGGGMFVTRQIIKDWEENGLLTCPKTRKGWRIFTGEQLEEIVRAFYPGGKGEWHYK